MLIRLINQLTILHFPLFNIFRYLTTFLFGFITFALNQQSVYTSKKRSVSDIMHDYDPAFTIR